MTHFRFHTLSALSVLALEESERRRRLTEIRSQVERDALLRNLTAWQRWRLLVLLQSLAPLLSCEKAVPFAPNSPPR